MLSFVHPRFSVVVAGADSYSKPEHVFRLSQIRSVTSVGSDVWYSDGVHVLSGVHTRCEVRVGAVSSNSALEHVIRTPQNRFDVAVGSVCMNCTSTVHSVSGVHTRSDVSVGAAD